MSRSKYFAVYVPGGEPRLCEEGFESTRIGDAGAAVQWALRAGASEVQVRSYYADEKPSSGLQWTTEPPTKPGWYWFWHADSDSIEPKYVAGNEQWVRGPMYDRNLWAGPIEAPPLPVKEGGL